MDVLTSKVVDAVTVEVDSKSVEAKTKTRSQLSQTNSLSQLSQLSQATPGICPMARCSITGFSMFHVI